MLIEKISSFRRKGGRLDLEKDLDSVLYYGGSIVWNDKYALIYEQKNMGNPLEEWEGYCILEIHGNQYKRIYANHSLEKTVKELKENIYRELREAEF